MTKKILLVGAALLAMSTTANASLIALDNVAMRRSAPVNPSLNYALVSGSGTWTWDTATNQITQTGTNAFTFGPTLPSTVAYILSFSDAAIDAAGSTTASAYSCTDGAWPAEFLAVSICGGYDFYGGNYEGNFTNDSTFVINATTCTRTLGGNDNASTPMICLSNAFNNGTQYGANGTNAMTTRDTTSLPGKLLVGPANFTSSSLWGSGGVGSGWQLQFDLPPIPIPAAGWLLGSALCGLLGFCRRQSY